MRTEDASLTEAVDRLAAGEDTAFLDGLWVRVEDADRAAARRWRLATVLVAAVAVVTVTAVTVVAATRGTSSTIDATVRCAVQDRGGLPAFDIEASPTTQYPGSHRIPATIVIRTGQSGTPLLVVANAYEGYRLDDQACKPAPRIPLNAHGLPGTAQAYHAGQLTDFKLGCAVGRLVLRVHVTTDRKGVITAATLAVRATKQAKPIAYLDWTPRRVLAHSVPPSRCSAY